MARLKYFSIMFVTLLLLTTCDKNNKDSSRQIEYMIFGQYYGECGGKDCVSFYKLDCCQIFEDTNDVYPSIGQQFDGKFIELDPNKRDTVSFLIHRIPHVLFFETTKVIGKPDAADGGGLYVEIKCVGEPIQYWYIDKVKSNIPTYLYTFVDDLNTAINRMK
jgi:hypothetical protein